MDIKAEDYKPCVVCGKSTNLIDICSEQRLCSEECGNKYYDEIIIPEIERKQHINIFKKWFNKWNDYSYCPKCKCKETKICNEDYIDGHILCEYDTVCAKCGNVLNHYAYGYIDTPETKIEYVKYLWRGYIFNGVKNFIRWVWVTLDVLFG